MTVKTKKKALWFVWDNRVGKDGYVLVAKSKARLEGTNERDICIAEGRTLCSDVFEGFLGFLPAAPVKVTLEWKEPA